MFTEPPSIVKAELVMVTSKGHTKYLTCETTGSPEPAITWTRFPSGQIIAIVAGKGLVLRGVNNSDDDVLFQCTASNPLGNVSMNVSVTIYPGKLCVNYRK